jgi:prevent-host-death family protein
MEEIGIEQARLTLGEIVDRARLTNQPTRITRHGKPAVVVVGLQWFEQASDVVDMALHALECGGFSVGDMEDLRETQRSGMLLTWTCHHLDRNPHNNDPSNLEPRKRPS